MSNGRLAAWGLSDPLGLPWLDPPPAAALAQARDLLTRLEAIDEEGCITAMGKAMVRLPLHPRLAHMVVRGRSMRAAEIAGMLSDLPAVELARQFRELRDLSSRVADWEPPYRVFKAIEGTCLACNAGPHLTDLGLTDGGSRQIVDPLIACREIPEPTDHNNNPQGA